MRIEKITDKSCIREFLMSDGIREEIGYDGEEIEVPDDFTYIAGYNEEKMFGLCIYHSYRDSSIIHMNILPGYRKQYGRTFGRQCLDLGPETIYAEIPEDYQNVIRYSQSFGFKVIEESTKNGLNVNILRLTRGKEDGICKTGSG